ncbi:hypothetical protein H6F46_06840 [Limnothrix sp. FACHB-1083]|uniref:hypothetical protein n=1 Tax=unclassified Limnothrix TaxID=2632864 RepID=UPI001681BB0C|nr:MULTISPECIES: hypothetical protein [unclassified Limnothrix]MBD2160409.1 hypothetical protein [Limnothrix sp. FACHB-1083]MBD2191110.1 hypothetical protein [Limnothrix sp. FACHB-1088]
MFGIRNFLKRHLSVEALTSSVERKIASDMARDPSHPRNAIGGKLIASIQSVREQAIARRELEDLVPAHNIRAIEVKAEMDFFVSQTPEWQVAHADERERIQRAIDSLNQTSERIKSLADTAGIELNAVDIHHGALSTWKQP